MRSTIIAAAGLFGLTGVLAHEQMPIVPENANWMTKHMAEEHHIVEFDLSSFFGLHDFNGNGRWEPDEMLRTYGLMDQSNKDVPESKRDEYKRQLLQLLDGNRDGSVTYDEFAALFARGGTLPDLGTGPGHHGDDEYEYEIHHWEKYHDENTPFEELNHPEDIEHFRKHDEMEAAEERLEALDRMPIVHENIPAKFRRSNS
ncbi:putative secretory pathway protein Ssp120 [Xylaria sp. CBS 124048]|nr:putative secretory pathway protein Ssp120 [Xylaria sp. CBS 124048]